MLFLPLNIEVEIAISILEGWSGFISKCYYRGKYRGELEMLLGHGGFVYIRVYIVKINIGFQFILLSQVYMVSEQ